MYNQIVASQVSAIPLRFQINTAIRDKILMHCTPETDSIEFNIYGKTEDGIVIAEATTSRLLSPQRTALSDIGLFKLFQLERQLASMKHENLKLVVLFSADKEEFFEMRLVKNVLQSFPELNRISQDKRNILKHSTIPLIVM